MPKRWGSIKPKDMIGIPWMLAFALREFGYYLRSDIIWHKINGLPENVKDRLAKSYEVYFWEIVKLLKEVLLNETVNKSLLSSLFNTWVPEMSGKDISREKFKQGRYAETPDYLSAFEMSSLRELRY